MGMEDFGVLWVWVFCGDSHRFFYEYGMGNGIEIIIIIIIIYDKIE